ncbi:MAG: hypothetical protein J6C91_05885, partial [Muribaculaceae bacterium]|nr:hypothetical protein [Muribaculaceae bacterium]
DFSCATEFYYSLGFNLLLVDQRSHGRSDGKYIGFGALERLDSPPPFGGASEYENHFLKRCENLRS